MLKMTQFKIYTKSKKFVWTRKRILFGIFIVSFIIVAIKGYLLPNFEYKSDKIAQIVGFIGISALFVGIINSFFPEEPKGDLNGNLIFDYSKIIMNNKNYDLTDIKSIKISTATFKGQFFPKGYSAFSDNISNGINNEVKILLNSGDEVKCNFEIDSERKIFLITDVLKNYVDEGNLTLENFLDIIK